MADGDDGADGADGQDGTDGQDGEDLTEPTDEPVLLALGGTHRFEDGFTVTMGPVDRRTEPAQADSFATGVEDETDAEGSEPADDLGDEEGWEDDDDEEWEEEPGDQGLDEDDLWEEEALEEESDGGPVEEPAPEDEGDDPAEDDPVEDEPVEDDPVEDGPVDEDPVEESEEEPEDEGADYYAWTVELANGSEERIHTGSIFTECSVGAPLTLSSAPLLGEALNPPMALAPEQGGAWDADCWADEDDPTLQWTLEFIDEQGQRLYPVLIFEGQVT